MRRREFITLIGGAAAWPLAARAQQGERVRRVGVLHGYTTSDPEWQRRAAAFRRGLQKLGWAEGRNVAFEMRSADGHLERLPVLAAELVRMNVDVIITQGTEPTEAALKATRNIPIVMASIGDAVGAGIIASLARPGGNVTGLTLVATEQASKRLELLKDILPSLSRVAILWNANNASNRLQVKDIETGARLLGVQIQSVGVRDTSDIEKDLLAAAQSRAEALITMDDLLIQFNRARIIEIAMQQRLPVVSEFRPLTEAGALMSYGPSLVSMWLRTAVYVDKIFRGAKPADLPVEQPTRFELLLNLKTAKALGLTLPPSLLALADEVIE
jgi:putative tryptophan/tyrosine transport system substrate-binding protein